MVKKTMHSFFVASIDLESSKADLSFERQRDIRRASDDLVRLFDRYQMPATWAVGDPGNDSVTAPILSSGGRHEIALQGDVIWPEARTNRANFSARLQRSLFRAHERGIPINSLVGMHVADEFTDLLVKNDIRVLRCDGQASGRAARWSVPNSVRYGVWNLAESCRFPGPKSWLGDITSNRFKRMVRTAAARQKTFHLVIDAVQVAASSSSSLKTLEAVLDCAAKYRHLGQLETATLGGAVSDMTFRPTRQAARSILKVA